MAGPTILIAPDSFKGTFSAQAVAAAVAAGVREAGGTAVELPIADGGEGTLDALVAARRGTVVRRTASGPLGDPVDACFAWIDPRTAIVETASASGLTLVPEPERDAWAASTRGTGELIAAAAEAGAEHVIVGVGGSATSDGGLGALEELDRRNVDVRLTVVCDVDTPWERAPSVFAPQKGADPHTVRRLEQRLDALAERAPRDPRGVPRTGAAGGLSGGLWAFRDAELVPGAAYVLDAVDFDRLLAGATVVVTGEGSLDEQTFAGKAVGEVAHRAGAAGVPCVAVVGRSQLSPERARRLGVAEVLTTPTLNALRLAGRRIATPRTRASV
jgi:glycerate kinase